MGGRRKSGKAGADISLMAVAGALIDDKFWIRKEVVKRYCPEITLPPGDGLAVELDMDTHTPLRWVSKKEWNRQLKARPECFMSTFALLHLLGKLEALLQQSKTA